MTIYELVFSPTGGTKKAADVLAESLGDSVETIDLSRTNFPRRILEGEGLALIAMPSFGGRAPQMAIERLSRIQSNGMPAVVAAVYGNRAQEDTLLEMADAAEQCGFEVIAGISAVAEHSIMRQYASGRPDVSDMEQLRQFSQSIQQKIEGVSSFSGMRPDLPGNRPYKKAGTGLVPVASGACTACGLCAAVCPAGAIDRSAPRQTDKHQCITCMRCVSVCPQHARSVNTVMAKAAALMLKKACSQRKENELFL